jgi:2-polyprenyl-3-methyl-5-hydroxy-6-metoxy-1,4-benzoquinol methylase
MKYIYNLKSLPPIAPGQLRELDEAAERLIKKLKAINPGKLPLSDDAKESVIRVQKDLTGVMKKYVHLMSWALYPQPNREGLVLVDYGGGIGILSCLGREAGFPYVVYNDIFEPCCRDARILGEQLGCLADEYVCGDIHDVSKGLVSKRNVHCVLISINVIEHIYDIDDFLHTAAGLSQAGVNMVLSTSANPLNPIVRRRHHRQHLEWEHTDGPHNGCGAMDTLKAFYDVRRDIIKQAAQSISQAECADLAAATRGLKKEDIELCVKHYQQTGKISATPEHPTNTCDPLTGNWQERLLNIEAVKKTLMSLGFTVRIAAGYYDAISANSTIRIVKRPAARVLNHAISWLGKNGVRIAPCFMFHATHTKQRS